MQACAGDTRRLFKNTFFFVSTKFQSLEIKDRVTAQLLWALLGDFSFSFLFFFPVMKHISWDKISSSLCHTVQHQTNAALGGVFAMLFFCCLKGQFVVICTLYFVLFSASRIVLSPETCAFFLEARHPKSSVSGPVWWGPTIFAFEGLNFYSGNGFFLNLSVRSVFCMKQYLGISKFIKSKKGNVWSGKPQDKRAIACTDKKNFVSIAKSRAFLYVTTLSDQVSWLKWGRWRFSEKYCLFFLVCNILWLLCCPFSWTILKKENHTIFQEQKGAYVFV